MRPFILFLLLCIIVNGCIRRGVDDNTITHEKAAPVSAHQQLLSKYITITQDTLHIYSCSEPYADSFYFAGTYLDSALSLLLTGNKDHQLNSYYACFQFPIDSTTTGLITRTPSEYTSSSIRLFLYDKQKDTIYPSLELAESWGDAGDYMSKDAWLFWGKEHHQLNCFVWQTNGHDNSMDNEKDTTQTEENLYYLVGISKGKSDTLNYHAAALAKRFK